MNIPMFIALLCFLQLICMIAGRRASKNVQTEKDYFLAGRNIKLFPLMMTFVATQVGGGLVLGSAEEAYRFGWPSLLYPAGICLGLFLLAGGIGRRLAQFQVSTVAELFEVVYKSTFLKKIASGLSIISLFMVLIAQVIASKKFMLSLGVSDMTLFYFFWALVVLYTVIGGLKAVVSIDIVQAGFFLIVFLTGFGYVLSTQDISTSSLSSIGSESFDYSGSRLAGWLFMPLLFMVIEQDMAQRCFAATSPKTVSRAAVYSAIVTLLISVIPVYFGILARSSGLEIPAGSSVFMIVVQKMTNPTFAAFLGCAVIMAIISTAISLMNAVSSNLTQDFSLSGLKSLSEVQKSRLITAAIGIGSLIGSLFFNNVVELLIQSYELSVYCLFVPVFAALFRPAGNTRSAYLAIVFGAFGFILFRFVSIDFPKEVLCVLLSGIGFAIGELSVRKERNPQLS